jgi:hypothetical protein
VQLAGTAPAHCCFTANKHLFHVVRRLNAATQVCPQALVLDRRWRGDTGALGACTGRSIQGLKMPRRTAILRQCDLRRALRAAKSAGIDIERVEVDPLSGKIVIIAKGATAGSETALDTWLAANAHTRSS